VLSCIMLNNGNLFALMVRLRVAKGEGRTGRKPGKLGVAVGKQALSRSSPHLRRSASRPGATMARKHASLLIAQEIRRANEVWYVATHLADTANSLAPWA
jgi:hypothetical protein